MASPKIIRDRKKWLQDYYDKGGIEMKYFNYIHIDKYPGIINSISTELNHKIYQGKKSSAIVIICCNIIL